MKVKGYNEVNHSNTNEKKTRVALLMSAKGDFRARNITRDKKVHFIMIKGSVHQKDIITIHVYTSNSRALKYTKQKR